MKSLKFLFASSVFALSFGTSGAQAAAADAATPVASTPDIVETGDIVVTARHSNERLQDIPLAINAQTAAC